jgi:two-component system OmpR family response regulator
MAQQLSSSGAPESDAPRAGVMILVIDDDRTILDLISSVLRDEGYTVEPRLTGQDALEHPCASSPAVCVLDMFLPGTSGAELADALREQYGADLPICVISASRVEGEALALGAYEYLPKPFDLEDLLDCVQHGVELRAT